MGAGQNSSNVSLILRSNSLSMLRMSLLQRTLDKQWVVRILLIQMAYSSNKFCANNRKSLQVWVTIPTTTCFTDSKSINHLDLRIQIIKPTSYLKERPVLEMHEHSGWKEMEKAEEVQDKRLTRHHHSPTLPTQLYQWDHSMKLRIRHIWFHSGLSTEKLLIWTILGASGTWQN